MVPERSTTRWVEALPWLLVLFGAVIRIAWWSRARSLWIDEALIGVNVFGRSFGELIGLPLNLQQSAPPGFLALVWAASKLPMTLDLSLRLPSLLAGLALPGCTLLLARRLGLGSVGVVLAVATVTFAPQFVHYSAAVKPYGLDALVAVAVLLLAAPAVIRGTRLWQLALGGSFAMLFSTPSAFVLASVGVVGFCNALGRRNRAECLRWIGVGGLWAATFVLLYLALFREIAASGFMQRFWSDTFLDLDVRSLVLVRNWMVEGLGGRTDEFAFAGFGALLLVAVAVAGLLSAVRRPANFTALTLGPIVVVAIASAAHKYPFADRLLLFTIPLVGITVAGGIEALAWRHPRYIFRSLALGMALLVVGRGIANTMSRPEAFIWREDVGPLLNDPAFRAARDEPVYLFPAALPAWLIYSDDGPRNRARYRFFARLSDSLGPPGGNAPSRGRPVEDEGAGLVFSDAGRRILLGVPTGYEGVYRPQWSVQSPTYATDPGWGDNEALRIVRESGGCSWVVFTHYKPFELDSLDAALRRQGHRLDRREGGRGVELRRYCQ